MKLWGAGAAGGRLRSLRHAPVVLNSHSYSASQKSTVCALTPTHAAAASAAARLTPTIVSRGL
jgi:hypothetical protein